MTSHDPVNGDQVPAPRIGPLRERINRRTFLTGAAAVGAAAVAGPALLGARAVASRTSRPAPATPIEHVIIDCQENRSFDHYYGFAPFAGTYGVPPGYSQPDGQGGFVAPYHFTSLSTPDSGQRPADRAARLPAGRAGGRRQPDGVLRVLSSPRPGWRIGVLRPA